MVRKLTATLQRSALRILDKIVRIEFVNRNENVVPLQCQMKEVAEAAIKDKNCEH